MIVLHLFLVLISGSLFLTTIGALCGSVLIVGCLKSKGKKDKDITMEKNPMDKKDPTASKEEIKKKPALAPLKPKPAVKLPSTPKVGAPPLDTLSAKSPNTFEKDKPVKKSKGKKKETKNTWDSENTVKPPSSMQSLKKKKPKNTGGKTVMRRDAPKSLESGEHDDIESAKCMEVPTDELLQSGKDRGSCMKKPKGMGSEVDNPPPSLLSKMGEFDKKLENNGKDKQNEKEIVIKAVPEELTYAATKASIEQQGSFELINESDVPFAIKIKCTDANLFKLAPIFRKIDPKEKTQVQVTRMPCVTIKPDVIEIVTAPINETLLDKAIPEVFKVVDVKDHKTIKVHVKMV